MNERQRLICAVALYADGFSCGEIAAALGATSEEASALLEQGEKEQSEGRIGRWVGEGTLFRLTAQEQTWLDDFRSLLQEQFPGLVEDIIVHGPWARGIRDQQVERDMLVIIREGGREAKDSVGNVAFDVDIAHSFTFSPAVMVSTKDEWNKVKQTGSSFHIHVSAVESGISVK